MRTETPPIVRLEDYRPSDFLIDRVELDIRLHPTETRITRDLGGPAEPDRADRMHRSCSTATSSGSSRYRLDGRAAPRSDYAATPQS